MDGHGWPSLRWTNTCSVMLAAGRIVPRGDGIKRLSLLNHDVLRRFAPLEAPRDADIQAHGVGEVNCQMVTRKQKEKDVNEASPSS
jgi:hypothetical protein